MLKVLIYLKELDVSFDSNQRYVKTLHIRRIIPVFMCNDFFNIEVLWWRSTIVSLAIFFFFKIQLTYSDLTKNVACLAV